MLLHVIRLAFLGSVSVGGRNTTGVTGGNLKFQVLKG